MLLQTLHPKPLPSLQSAAAEPRQPVSTASPLLSAPAGNISPTDPKPPKTLNSLVNRRAPDIAPRCGFALAVQERKSKEKFRVLGLGFKPKPQEGQPRAALGRRARASDEPGG